MARFTGYICDFADCNHTGQAEDDKHMPPGWISLRVHVNGSIDPSSTIQLCSNKCLLAVAKERRAADRENEPKRTGGRPSKYTDEQKAEAITALAEGHTQAEVAELLDIPKATLARWALDARHA